MREWLIDSFGMDGGTATGVVFVVALIVVVTLFAAGVWIVRRLGHTRFGATGRTRQPRIAVMDQTHIDARRRLLLVRRDNVEHLVLIGGPTDVVVEQNIIRGQSVAKASRAPYAQSPAQPAAASSAVAEPAPARHVAPAVAAGAAAAAITSEDNGEAPPEARRAKPAAMPQDSRADNRRRAENRLKRQEKQHRAERRKEAPVTSGNGNSERGKPPARGVGNATDATPPVEPAPPELAPPVPTPAEPRPEPRKPDAGSAVPPRVQPAGTASDVVRVNGDGAETAKPAPSPDQPTRGPASRLGESLFSRNRKDKPSAAGSLSASIAAAAGLRAPKAEPVEPAPKIVPTPEPAAEATERPGRPDPEISVPTERTEPVMTETAPAVEPQTAPETTAADETDHAAPEPVVDADAPRETRNDGTRPAADATVDAPDRGARADDIEIDLGLMTGSEAPTIEIGADDEASPKPSNNDETDSIEEEMAKLLSELSGKPDS